MDQRESICIILTAVLITDTANTCVVTLCYIVIIARIFQMFYSKLQSVLRVAKLRTLFIVELDSVASLQFAQKQLLL